MAMSLSRKLNSAFLVFVFLGGLALAYLPYIEASNKMKTFCNGLPAGATLAEVQTRAEAAGYALSPPAGGVAQVDDERSFGRLACRLQLDAQGRVQSTRQADD